MSFVAIVNEFSDTERQPDVLGEVAFHAALARRSLGSVQHVLQEIGVRRSLEPHECDALLRLVCCAEASLGEVGVLAHSGGQSDRRPRQTITSFTAERRASG